MYFQFGFRFPVSSLLLELRASPGVVGWFTFYPKIYFGKRRLPKLFEKTLYASRDWKGKILICRAEPVGLPLEWRYGKVDDIDKDLTPDATLSADVFKLRSCTMEICDLSKEPLTLNPICSASSAVKKKHNAKTKRCAERDAGGKQKKAKSLTKDVASVVEINTSENKYDFTISADPLIALGVDDEAFNRLSFKDLIIQTNSKLSEFACFYGTLETQFSKCAEFLEDVEFKLNEEKIRKGLLIFGEVTKPAVALGRHQAMVKLYALCPNIPHCFLRGLDASTKAFMSRSFIDVVRRQESFPLIDHLVNCAEPLSLPELEQLDLDHNHSMDEEPEAPTRDGKSVPFNWSDEQCRSVWAAKGTGTGVITFDLGGPSQPNQKALSKASEISSSLSKVIAPKVIAELSQVSTPVEWAIVLHSIESDAIADCRDLPVVLALRKYAAEVQQLSSKLSRSRSLYLHWRSLAETSSQDVLEWKQHFNTTGARLHAVEKFYGERERSFRRQIFEGSNEIKHLKSTLNGLQREMDNRRQNERDSIEAAKWYERKIREQSDKIYFFQLEIKGLLPLTHDYEAQLGLSVQLRLREQLYLTIQQLEDQGATKTNACGRTWQRLLRVISREEESRQVEY
ncbi:OLC1v1024782C1 [Oldenlandia corymbosa var. corymbosa]|uniref:OLC1v1024782C1 n=1 Tax=Oldenlandia corymbosa var. corymbosa TaxID=529605 RepID=A0AAV1C6M1_OLDCO|nr:OLC1v1024782C1 [Oldenlandia corymbosa var. corymbosa]